MKEKEKLTLIGSTFHEPSPAYILREWCKKYHENDFHQSFEAFQGETFSRFLQEQKED